jgi:integrase
MAKDKKTTRFWLRKDRENLDTTCPVHLVYQVKGVRKVYGVPDLHLLPENWDVKKQSAFYISPAKAKKKKPEIKVEKLLSARQAEEVNNKLAGIRAHIARIEKRLELDNIPITPQAVVDMLKEQTTDTTKKEQPGNYIVDFIKKYVSENEGTHKSRTLQAYLGLATHLSGYEEVCGIRATFEHLDIPYLRGFVGHLLKPKEIVLPSGRKRNLDRMNNITVAKQISTLKTLLKFARILYGITPNQAYQDFKVTRNDSHLEVITLTEEEFKSMYNLDLTENKRLDQVRDVFCFSCATGLRYSDLAQLKREHIRHGVIKITVAKTKRPQEIPLNPYSYAILEKYKERHRPLPIISGQKTNQYIKELGKLAGIDTPVEKVREYGTQIEKRMAPKHKFMSIHMGRKTFTTLSLEKGMAPQEVMSLTGHTTFKSFKRYVDVTNDRKKAVMAQAWGEVKDNNLKVV